jgi:hypothetical protein
MIPLATACVQPTDPDDEEGLGWDIDPRDTSVENAGGDTSPEPEDTAPDTGAPPIVGNADHLFGIDVVHTIDLTISEDGQRALRQDYKTYVPADITIDGETLANVGVRLKGSSSYRPLSGKSAFKVDLNENEDLDYYGLQKLTLNNMLNDETQLHEGIAYEAFRLADVPCSRIGYAWVTVNGEDYGLYLNLETVDDRWGERMFGHDEGRVYEGGYPYYPESYTHADFVMREVENFELETGDDVQWADLSPIAAAVRGSDEAFDEAASPYADLDEYARFQVGESWVGQWDGYAFASNNFRVYVDAGGDELMRMLPSGLDWTFTDYASNWGNSTMPLGRSCQASEACNARMLAAVDQVCDAVDGGDLLTRFDALQALLAPYIEADPRKELRMNRLASEQAAMREWIEGRSVKIRKAYGVQ